MSLLAIILILILLGGVGWGYPYGGRPAYWGGGPVIGGVLFVFLIILVLALLSGRL